MIVFDLDDTLYKEKDYVASGKEAVNNHLLSRNPHLTAQQLDDAVWTDSDKQIYREHIPSISLSDEDTQVLELLQYLDEPMAVITHGPSVQQRNKFNALNLSRFIPDKCLSISEEIGYDKTSPYPFALLMKAFPGEEPWIYVADNPDKDFKYPNALNWTTIMLRDINNVNIHPQSKIEDYPLDHRPKFVVDSLKEIIPIYLSLLD